MLRTIAKRLAASSQATLVARLGTAAAMPPPPKPPADQPAENFEWEYVINAAQDEEEKKEIKNLKHLFGELELLNRKEFKMTVDWEEFEGKVPPKILEKYKEIHAEAEKEFEAGTFDFKFDEGDWEQKTGELLKTAETIAEQAKARVDELEAEIKKTDGKLARLETATLEEEMALDPELAKRVDDAVSKELGYTP